MVGGVCRFHTPRNAQLDDAELADFGYGLSSAVDVELSIRPVDVGLDSVHRDDQLLSDILVRHSSSDVAEDLDLSFRKRFDEIARRGLGQCPV